MLQTDSTNKYLLNVFKTYFLSGKSFSVQDCAGTCSFSTRGSVELFRLWPLTRPGIVPMFGWCNLTVSNVVYSCFTAFIALIVQCGNRFLEMAWPLRRLLFSAANELFIYNQITSLSDLSVTAVMLIISLKCLYAYSTIGLLNVQIFLLTGCGAVVSEKNVGAGA